MDYTLDLKGKSLGRAASEAAVILQGKKSPSYAPHKAGDDVVLVKNVEHVTMTTDPEQKKYFRHSGYIGNLKEKTFAEAFEKNPEWVFKEAVRRMLPKNKLSDRRLKNLKFTSSE